MKIQNNHSKISIIILITLCLCASVVKSDTNYVSLFGSHILPFYTWETAATNIQSAVDVAIDGDLVLVTNGTYKGIGHEIDDFGFSVVSVTNAITVKSVNGAEVTIVDGENLRRPFFVGNGVILNGFLLTNGYAPESPYFDYQDVGGGAVCMPNGTIKNCNVINNYAWYYGGGIYCHHGGKVLNCVVNYNFDNGISAIAGGFISNCVIIGNASVYGSGGIILTGGEFDGIIIDSIIINNSVTNNNGVGGGIGATETVIKRCIITNNTAFKGAGVECSEDVSIYNSLIADNNGVYGAGIGSRGGVQTANNLILQNCTIVNNYATNSGGGVYAFRNSDVRNCIIYNNHGGDVAEMDRVDFDYSCIGDGFSGTGNISNNPAFVVPLNKGGKGDLTNIGDYRLRNDSPCINTGTNKWIEWWDIPVSSNDLAGNTRIHAGTIDMGCFENQDIILLKPEDILSEKSSFRIKWLSLSNDMFRAMFDIAKPENFTISTNAFYTLFFGDLFVSSADLPEIKSNKKGTRLTLKSGKKVEPKILLSLKERKKGTLIRLLVKMKKADIALDLVGHGVTNTNTPKGGIEISIPTRISLDKWLREKFAVGMEYKSKKDKKCNAKSLSR